MKEEIPETEFITQTFITNEKTYIRIDHPKSGCGVLSESNKNNEFRTRQKLIKKLREKIKNNEKRTSN